MVDNLSLHLKKSATDLAVRSTTTSIRETMERLSTKQGRDSCATWINYTGLIWKWRAIKRRTVARHSSGF